MRGENDPLPRRLKCALVFFLELTAGLPSGRTAICLIASISWSKGSHWLDAALNWVTSMSGRKSKQGLYLAAGSNESWPDFPLARHGNLIRLMPPLHVDSSDSIVLTSTVQTSGSSYPFCEAAHKPPPPPSIHPSSRSQPWKKMTMKSIWNVAKPRSRCQQRWNVDYNRSRYISFGKSEWWIEIGKQNSDDSEHRISRTILGWTFSFHLVRARVWAGA